jgi:hypothetical protein
MTGMGGTSLAVCASMEQFLEAEQRFVEKQQRAMDDIKHAMDAFLVEQRLVFQRSSFGAPAPRVGGSSRQQSRSGPEKQVLLSSERASTADSGSGTESVEVKTCSLDDASARAGQWFEQLFHTKTNRKRDIKPKHWPQHTLLPLVRSMPWNLFSALIVVSMCLSLGVEVHCHMKEEVCLSLHRTLPCNVYVSRDDPTQVLENNGHNVLCPAHMSKNRLGDWWRIINLVLFTIEMFVRILAEQGDFYAKSNLMKWWNILDSCLWVVSVVDLVREDPVVQVLRVIRLGRAIRLFELFPELRGMFYSCFACFESLGWAFFLLACFMYMVAIYLMEVAVYYLSHNNGHTLLNEAYLGGLASNWNGLYISLMSLVYSITGGLDWQQVAEPYYHMGTWGDVHGFVFTFFIFMSTIGLLNILVGVFVQKANDVGSVSRDAALAQSYLKIMDTKRNMEELFDEFDKDNSEEITTSEIERGLTEPRIQAYFRVLEIDIVDKNLFLNHFDEDHDGSVSKEEFVEGCQRLQGSTRPLRELRRVLDEIKELKDIQQR